MPPFIALAASRTSGHEQDAVAEIVADDFHSADQRLGQDTVWGPIPPQEDVDALLDLLLEAVIEVIKHLFDELFVVQVRKNDVIFVGHVTFLHRAINP